MEEKNFEKSMQDLENIVTELEKGELNLDESAEKKITILLENNGNLEEKSFETNNE